eukprot:jgi/Tetstr1/448537/TSEL_035799.t2
MLTNAELIVSAPYPEYHHDFRALLASVVNFMFFARGLTGVSCRVRDVHVDAYNITLQIGRAVKTLDCGYNVKLAVLLDVRRYVLGYDPVANVPSRARWRHAGRRVCLRKGAASAANAIGVPLSHIRYQGGWATNSDVVLDYIDPNVLPSPGAWFFFTWRMICMGRNKKKKREFEEIRIYCFYCDRQFKDEEILIDHQRAKHFKCEVCNKKLSTAKGLATHCYQVHRVEVTSVPNAKEGNGSIELDIYGMAGVDEALVTLGRAPEEPDAKQAKAEEAPAAGAAAPVAAVASVPPVMPGAPAPCDAVWLPSTVAAETRHGAPVCAPPQAPLFPVSSGAPGTPASLSVPAGSDNAKQLPISQAVETNFPTDGLVWRDTELSMEEQRASLLKYSPSPAAKTRVG